MSEEPTRALSLRGLALASSVPLLMMIAAMLLKPLWRDEYWSLFFSDPGLDLAALIETRMIEEVHPPLYYIGLYLWRGLLPDDPVIARFLSLPILLAGAALILLLGRNRRETAIFLLLSLGSYWVIYFAAEVRPYALLYVGCALSVFLLARMVEGPNDGRAWLYPLWTLLGVLVGLTHYFGGIWFAAAGLCAGVAELIAKRPGRFMAIGVATTIAVVPAVAWALLSAQRLDPSLVQPSGNAFGAEMIHVLNQFLRGLVVKTFGSNPLVLLAGFAGAVAALRFKQRLSSILVFAALVTVLVAFAVHFAAVNWIKERAFIVIMPALIFVFARHISALRAGDGLSARFASYIPVAAAVMPFLFIPEYFKDRERLGDLQHYVRNHAEACQGQPLLIYYRPSLHDEFQPAVARIVLRSAGGGQMFDLRETDPNAAQQASAPPSTCPIKAAALLLEKGEGESQRLARQAFARAGLNLERLHEHAFGKGRNLLLVDEASLSGS